MDKLVLGKDGSWSLFSQRWGEGYHSRIGAYTETQMIYGRACIEWMQKHPNPKSVHVVELGFGLGYGFAVANQFMNSFSPSVLRSYTGYELKKPQMMPPLPQFIGWLTAYRSQLYQDHAVSIRGVSNRLIMGDINCMWDSQNVDILFWDAFSPRRAPECWNSDLFARVFQCMNQNACLVTFSASKKIRHSLESVGFVVDALPLAGPKREGTLAWRSD